MTKQEFNTNWNDLLNRSDEPADSFLKAVINTLKVSELPANSLYLTPQGNILDLGDSGEGHTLLAELLFLKGIEVPTEESPDEYSEYLYNKGWIRANTGFIKYLQLTATRPTTEQYALLIPLIDALQPEVEIVYENGSKIYRNRPTDEIVKLIKRYYSSGVLYEQLN